MVKIINKGFSYLPYSRLNSEPDDQEHPASNPCEKLIHPPEKFLQQRNIFFLKTLISITDHKDFILYLRAYHNASYEEADEAYGCHRSNL